MVWLINGLHSRPEDGQAGRDLQRAILPHEVNPTDNVRPFALDALGEDEPMPSPCNPFGAVFLSGLKFSPHPRLRARPIPDISDSTFEYFFRHRRNVVENSVHPVGFINDDLPGLIRSENKKRITATYIDRDNNNIVLFSLSEDGHSLPAPDDKSSDVGSDDGELSDVEEDNDLDRALTTVWRQFLIDIAIKAPNRGTATSASYCRLTAEERLTIGEEFYQEQSLSRNWTDLHAKKALDTEWARARGHLWPARNHLAKPNAQNYGSSKYYRDWKRLLARLSDDAADAARAAVMKRLDSLYWIPNAAADRIWVTKPLKNFTRFPQGSTGAAPQILVRGWLPTWE